MGNICDAELRIRNGSSIRDISLLYKNTVILSTFTADVIMNGDLSAKTVCSG